VILALIVALALAGLLWRRRRSVERR